MNKQTNSQLTINTETTRKNKTNSTEENKEWKWHTKCTTIINEWGNCNSCQNIPN